MHWLALTICFAATFMVVYSGDCTISTDCRKNECCILSQQNHGDGYCKPLAKKGFKCSETGTTITFYAGTYYMKYCPCAEGLACQSSTRLTIEDDGVKKYLASLKCQVPKTTKNAEELTTAEEPATEESTTAAELAPTP